MDPSHGKALAGVGVSISAPFLAWVTQVNQIAEFAAYVVAFVSGAASSIYYIVKLISHLHDRSKSKNSEDSE